MHRFMFISGIFVLVKFNIIKNGNSSKWYQTNRKFTFR